jgi:hypothetical protein
MDMCKPQNYLERWELNALVTIYQISIYIYKSTCACMYSVQQVWCGLIIKLYDQITSNPQNLGGVDARRKRDSKPTRIWDL